jgi:lysozyme family protein
MNDAETENLFELIKKERIKRYKGTDTFDDHGTGWTDRVKDLTFQDDGTVKDSDIS